jgi:DNA-binding winged helix-turn-helix (wHTH) protein
LATPFESCVKPRQITVFCPISKIYFLRAGVFASSSRFAHFFLEIGMRVRFGECLLDAETHELLRQDQPVHLAPKAFQVLELLLETRPRVVSKSEIHEKVWPGTFVSEATLASAISDIRAAIGGGKRDARFIRTVHGVGYSFCGDATDVARSAAVVGAPCRLIWEDREIPLAVGENVLGRGEDVALRINDNSISRHHARITVGESSATLEDLGSKNGTFVHGCQIARSHCLSDGEEIRLGKVTLLFRTLSTNGSTSTLHRPQPESHARRPGQNRTAS